MKRCERSLQSCYVTANIQNLEKSCRGGLLFTSAHIMGAVRLQAAIALSSNCSSKATATPLRDKKANTHGAVQTVAVAVHFV